MPHCLAYCPSCEAEVSARDHCPVCNRGSEGSYSCPWCKKYILVGKHSIKPDHRRDQEERAKRIEVAARNLIGSPGDEKLMSELREALGP